MVRLIGRITDIVCCRLRYSHGSSGIRVFHALNLASRAVRGLVAMERHAEVVHAETGVEVVVFGFDTGKGMPAPQDYRDMPYLWQSGYFAMDVPKLRARLKSARLVLGDVTAKFFRARESSAHRVYCFRSRLLFLDSHGAKDSRDGPSVFVATRGLLSRRYDR
jgi:hypothetical protein